MRTHAHDANPATRPMQGVTGENNARPPDPPLHTRAYAHTLVPHARKGKVGEGKEEDEGATRTPFGPAPLTTVAEPVKMASLSYGVDRYPLDVTSTPFQMATLVWLSGG